MRPKALLALLAAALVAAACGGGREETADGDGARASPGITEDTVKLGSSYPFSGPVSAAATSARAMEAYFRYVNEEEGGIDGRRIELTVYDDGYSPPRGIENARRLVEEDQVFALAGFYGTPPNTAIAEYVEEREVPSIFVGSGASKWGTDDYEWIIGGFPAYTTEAAVLVEHLERVRPQAKLGVLYQNDDFGQDYLSGLRPALEGTGITIASEQSYETTDPTIDAQVANLAASGADVFLNFTVGSFVAKAIQAAHRLGWRPLQIGSNLTATVKSAFEPAGLDISTGIVAAQWQKEPSDPQWADDPGMQQYRRIVGQYGSGVVVDDTRSVSGYNIAQMVVAALRGMEEPTREALMRSAENLQAELAMTLPGIEVRTGQDDRYPIEAFQIARFNGETYQLEGDVIDYEGRTPTHAG